MTLARCLRDGHTHHPEKTALIFAEHAWTCAEVDTLTDRLATNLLAQGVKPEDRVALHMSNCPELVFSLDALRPAPLQCRSMTAWGRRRSNTSYSTAKPGFTLVSRTYTNRSFRSDRTCHSYTSAI